MEFVWFLILQPQLMLATADAFNLSLLKNKSCSSRNFCSKVFSLSFNSYKSYNLLLKSLGVKSKAEQSWKNKSYISSENSEMI